MSSARSRTYWSNDCASANGIVISVTVSSRALRFFGVFFFLVDAYTDEQTTDINSDAFT